MTKYRIVEHNDGYFYIQRQLVKFLPFYRYVTDSFYFTLPFKNLEDAQLKVKDLLKKENDNKIKRIIE